jgi:transcriptional regulator with XRE-family HTH domain
MNVVGPEVRRLRIQAGLSQPAFAAKCQRAGWDISRDIVARIEGGSRCVEDRELLKLAKLLDCSIPQLFPESAREAFRSSHERMSSTKKVAGVRSRKKIKAKSQL